jgi:diaminohydroxyphosphoribosylaminopyrimidine deaminase/5-amino-6-(5-phosphoribosylamino)uracil reductase
MKKGRFSPADVEHMRRALALAEQGRGDTRPNPVVGAVIVRDGQMLAEGYHHRAGDAHGEVDALSHIGGRAPGATIYVNLEPCCHTGRTGPCTTALIAAGIRRVVVGCLDPNPRVDGCGVSRLRRAGVRVDVGCLEDECRAANRAFLVWVRDRRPLVTLKAAATLDGFIAAVGGAPAWITGAAARQGAHRLRAVHDAILVGAGTVRSDDPQLTVRLRPSASASASASAWSSASPSRDQPLRVVLDGRLTTPPGARVLRRTRGGPATLVLGARGAEPRRIRALERAGAEVVLLAAGRGGRLPLARVLAELGRRDIQSLLVEGGAQIHGALIDARLVDRVAVFVAPKLVGAGVPIARGRGVPVSGALTLGPLAVEAVGDDLLIRADVLARR